MSSAGGRRIKRHPAADISRRLRLRGSSKRIWQGNSGPNPGLKSILRVAREERLPRASGSDVNALKLEEETKG